MMITDTDNDQMNFEKFSGSEFSWSLSVSVIITDVALRMILIKSTFWTCLGCTSDNKLAPMTFFIADFLYKFIISINR